MQILVMGLFNRKKDTVTEPAAKETATTQDTGRRFAFGRSKAAPDVVEQLPPPPSPWAAGVSPAQGSAATSALTSRRNSLSSVRSSVLQELKYEAMVNHLFQQQCSKCPQPQNMLSVIIDATIGRLWLNDSGGDIEGVLLRKSRGIYTTCPPALADSVLADCCSRLNLQVCTFHE